MKRLFFFLILVGCARQESGKGVLVKILGSEQKLIVAEDTSLPICNLFTVFKIGSILETADKEGLVNLMGEMLTRGTKTKTREQIRDTLDQLGAEIGVSVEHESIIISGQTLTRNLDSFLELYSDVILNPIFDPKEFDKLKREVISDLRQARESDQFLVSYFFKKALFQKHPYAMHPEGKEATIQGITQSEVKEFYKKYLIKQNILFAASGNIDVNRLVKKLDSYFHSVPDGTSAVVTYPDIVKLEGKRLFLIDKPARTQTQIIVGHLGIDIMHPDFFPLIVANNALGGGFTARLMQEVRVKRGWSYGAYSWYRPRKKPGEFGMLVFPASQDTLDTLKLVLKLYEDYAKHGITQVEFERSKNNLINEFPFKIDTARKKVSQLIMIELMGLDANYLETYVDKLKHVTLEHVNQVIKKHADPENLIITVVGTAKELEPKLKTIDKNLMITVQDFRSE